MFDQEKFFSCLKENKVSVQELAEMLEISRTTLYRKVSGESDFTRKEIQKCREIFGESVCDQIFFAVEVA